jgi:putative hydrolase of HD superfamily
MRNTIHFLVNIGKLKSEARKGWKLRGVKNPETIAAHTFRMAIMAWLLGERKRLNLNKIFKMSLIHDICEVYAGDTTPYDTLIPKNRKRIKEITNRWPTFFKREKEKNYYEKYKRECKALKELVKNLPPHLKREIKNLWIDYEKGFTREGRFVRQLDRVENLLQALEYWSKKKQFAIEPWWIQIEELVDDPILRKFIDNLAEKFHRKKK